MQKVLTAAQMREVDRRTTEEYGIPSILLMENAAQAVARVITEKLDGSVKGRRVLVLSGPGNNGGDGAALARLLHDAGAILEIYLWGKISESKGDARENFEKLKAVASIDPEKKGTLYLEEAPTIDGWVQVVGLGSDNFDVLVDALFGTGLSRPLDITFRDVPLVFKQRRKVDGIGWSDTGLVVSIDVPSGLNSDVSDEPDIHITAHTTVTFTSPKVANVLPQAYRLNGELVVADIGSPRELIDEQPSRLYTVEAKDAIDWLEKTRFSSDSYKNKRGHALLIAGSKNYTGAAVLAGDAAIRSGCGLVTLAVPESSRDSVVARVVPEVMVRGISETDEGSAAEKAADEIKGFLKNVDAIAIGSGMSANEETASFVRSMVDERTMPMLVDADGLTAISPLQKRARSKAGDRRELILTPHEGEFRKLLNAEKDEADEIIKDRVAAVREFATTHDVILVLKGERVLIGAPDGRVIVNPTGNSGLGKAGNGDTLTGILIGFVAQAVQMKIDMIETVAAACYVAGMAGDVAERKYGKRVMTASDVRECLVEVFESLEAN